MTIEIILRDGKKAVLNREKMTFKVGKETFRLPYWPIVETDGMEVCDNQFVTSWKEIPDELPAPTTILELPMVSSASVPSDAEGKQLNENNVPVPSTARVPDHDSGTDWIR